jgi:hypothetical protein
LVDHAVTVIANTPTYYALSSGVWSRKGHSSLTPGGGGTPPPGYDWTANSYGSVYDARPSGVRVAGGYVPDITANTCGIPTGSSTTTTISGTSGNLTVTSAGSSKGACTVTASTNRVNRAGHGLSNGHPVYFSTLTGGTGLAEFSANVNPDDFTLKQCDPLTGQWSAVDITADYTSATLFAGQWYDQVDFTCNITTTGTATGLCLITRSKVRGPAAAVTSQALVYNVPGSTMTIIAADSELTPDSTIAEQDSMFGANLWSFRIHSSHVTDGIGSLGGNHHFGGHFEKAAWFYPNPNHTDGSHCDTGMQTHYGVTHYMVGCNVNGFIDATASSTTDSSGHPIPTYANTAIIINTTSGKTDTSDVILKNCDLKGGATTVNVTNAKTLLNLLQMLGNQLHRNDASKPSFGNTRVVVTPNATPASAITLHCNYPSSGADANIDETSAVMTVDSTGSTGIFASGLGGNTTITWP